MVWKVTVPSTGMVCGGRRGGKRCSSTRINLVRYTNCSPCAIALKREYPQATIDEVEEPANPRLVQRRCEHDPGSLDQLATVGRAQDTRELAGAAV